MERKLATLALWWWHPLDSRASSPPRADHVRLSAELRPKCLDEGVDPGGTKGRGGEERPVAHPKFVVRKGRTGKFRFNLIGRNGKVIATSEAYESRTSALRGVELVRKYAASAELVDQAGTRVIGGSRKKAAAKRPKRLPASDVGPVPPDDAVPGDIVPPGDRPSGNRRGVSYR